MDAREQERQTQDHVSQYYEEVRYKVPWSRRYHDWLFGFLIKLLKPQGKILDAGCGNGLLAEYLPHQDLWGVDISPEMIKHAEKRLQDARVGDVEALPYEDNFFDSIFARSILHHLIDPKKGLAELTRVLKPGGRIIFMDTRDSLLSRLPRKIMNKGEHFSDSHQNMEEKPYLQMLGQRLTIEKKIYLGFIGYTLLGFPDVLKVYRWVPMKFFFTPFLMWIDRVWAHIPLLNKLALGIIVVAKKPKM